NQLSLILDDISVIATPTCEAPTALVTQVVTSTSASFSWTASVTNPGNGYRWELRTSGAAGSGATGLTNSGTTAAGVTNAATSVALTPNTNYTLYVRGDCNGDLSPWSSPLPIFTGYCQTSGSNASYFVNNFSTTNGFLNISNLNSGRSTNGYGDFTAMIVSSTAGGSVNFSAAYTGTTFHAGVWVDWNNDLDFNDANEQVFLNNASYSATSAGAITVPTGTPIGNYRMRIRINSTGNAAPCNVDALGEAEDYTFSVVAPPTCYAPTGLTVSNVTGSSAQVSWTNNASGAYNYEVRSSGLPGSGATGLALSGTVTSGTPAITLSPLLSGVNYTVYVQGSCTGGTDLSTWTSGVSFIPGTIQIGTGTTTNTNFPIYSCTAFNYTQQIYPAASYTGGGTYITKIRFKYIASGVLLSTWNDWTVYMGNTTKTAFNTTTDWVPASAMDQVFSGTVNPVAGEWMEITLDLGFLWDGTSNIVVAVDENSASTSCTATWASFTSVTNSGMYYRATTNPDPAAPPVATGRSG
ncbi:MAG: fibronectin type III domain-containing protein, partial [Flavobacteriales bacterium]